MKVLITGGAGFIGSHIADACIEAGHEVSIVDDLSSGSRANVPKKAKLYELDIRDEAALSKLVTELEPQAISHQAAQVSVSVSTREPTRDARINVEGTINLLEAAVKNGVGLFLFASTGGAIYGEIPPPHRGTIDRTPTPLSPYACSKLAVEGYLGYYEHTFGLRCSILRYANVYGPRQDPHGEAGVVAIFAKRLLAGEPIQINAMREPGDDGCIRDYVFVGDVVRANMLALEGQLGARVVNVGTGIETTTRDLAKQVEAASGKRATIGHAPKRAGDVERSVLEPHPKLSPFVELEQGIRTTVDWFKSRHEPR